MPSKYYMRGRNAKGLNPFRSRGAPRALTRKVKVKTDNLTMTHPMKSLVNKEIDRKIDTQFAAFHQRRTQYSNLISDDPTNFIWQVMPPVATGSLRDDRRGATCRALSLRLHGKIDIPADDNPPLGNDDRAQVYCRLMILSVKRDQLLAEVKNEWNTNYDPVFFKNNAQPTPPTGKYVDMVSNINRELFTVHADKVIKLNRHYPFFPDPTSTSGAASQIPTSRDFNISVRCKNKMLKYNTPSTVNPSNWQPFAVCLFAYGNGANPSTSKVPFIEYLSKLVYKP
ncbi:MAG: coat protein [Cressdnaviricota sp.]|nr:MAG: coat protein [Cressdnaviricota sp.]